MFNEFRVFVSIPYSIPFHENKASDGQSRITYNSLSYDNVKNPSPLFWVGTVSRLDDNFVTNLFHNTNAIHDADFRSVFTRDIRASTI